VTDSSALKPVYLICGSDQPKVRRAAARLRARVIRETGSDLNVSLRDASATSAAAIVDEANTPAFALGVRLLVVADADKWKAADRDVITRYLADPAPDTCLALIALTWAKSDKLHKAVEMGGEVLRYDLPERKRLTMARWVQETARRHGLALGRPEAHYLADLVGVSKLTSGFRPESREELELLGMLEREVEKLVAYAAGSPVTTADIDAVCSPSVETHIFELTDAVGSRDRRAAFGALETLYAHGEEAPAIFYALLRHLHQLERVSEMPAELPTSELAKALGVKPYTASKLAQQRANFSRRSLGQALVALSEAEVRLKGGAAFALDTERDTERFVLELALARLMGERRREA
jgi:DNA polymerase-3 subunit delta